MNFLNNKNQKALKKFKKFLKNEVYSQPKG